MLPILFLGIGILIVKQDFSVCCNGFSVRFVCCFGVIARDFSESLELNLFLIQ